MLTVKMKKFKCRNLAIGYESFNFDIVSPILGIQTGEIVV